MREFFGQLYGEHMAQNVFVTAGAGCLDPTPVPHFLKKGGAAIAVANLAAASGMGNFIQRTNRFASI